MRIKWRQDKVLELYSKGHNQSEIARILQVGVATISRCMISYMIISSVKEDFINHDLRATTHSVDRLPGKIAIKYNIPLSIAQEVAHHVIADRRSAIDHEPIIGTVFVYYKKEE